MNDIHIRIGNCRAGISALREILLNWESARERAYGHVAKCDAMICVCKASLDEGEERLERLLEGASQ
jgi:hypothetical protein